MSTFPIKRKLDALLAAAGLALVVLVTWVAIRHVVVQDVHLLNGTPAPLTISLDGSSEEVVPGGRSVVTVHPGVHHVMITSEGKALDEDWIDVPGGMDAVVYNPLGAALFCSTEIRYGSPETRDQAPDPKCFPGTTFWTQRHADYVFSQPPKTMEMDSHTRYVSKYLVELIGDWKETFGFVATGQGGQPADLAAFIDRFGRLPTQEALEQSGMRARLTEFLTGASAALSVAHGEFKLRPDVPEMVSLYSGEVRRAGEIEHLLPELRDEYLRNPDSPSATLAYVRLEPPAEAAKLLLPLADKDPEDPHWVVPLAVAEFRAGHSAQCAKAFQRVWEKSPDTGTADFYARALVDAGQTEKAAEVLADAAIASKSRTTLLQYASLVTGFQLTPTRSIREVAKKQVPDDSEAGAWLASLLPDSGWGKGASAHEMSDDESRIHRAALKSPADAWTECAKAGAQNAFPLLWAPLRLLLALEFDRMGDREIAQRLSSGLVDLSSSFASLRAYVRSGQSAPELVFLEPEERAALHFVRARALDAAGHDSSAEYASALHDDTFRGPISNIMSAWSHPTGAH